MTWRPGDPLHPVVDGITRELFEVLPSVPTYAPDVCGPWCCSASWPEPDGGWRIPDGDEIGRVIREAKEDA